MADIISVPSRFGSPQWELYYGGQRLHPAPLVAFSRSFNRNDNDEALSYEDKWTLTGLYLNQPSGCYEDVVENQTNIKEMFASDGLELTIQAGAAHQNLPSGTLVTSGIYPYVESLDLPQANDQFYRFNYEVVLVAKSAADGVSGVVDSSQDTWSYEEQADSATTSVSHTISAVGLNTAVSGNPSNALTNAKAFVDSRLGSANAPSGFPSYVVPGDVDDVSSNIFEFQRSRTESVDVETGSYEVTEVFAYVSGVLPYAENRTYQYDKDSEGIVNIGVQGTIQGYPRSDGTADPYAAFYNAQSGYINTIEPALGTDASGVYSTYGGSGTLSITNPQSLSITENRFLGTLAWSVSYTDDPAEALPSGIVEQSLGIQRKDGVRLMVSHVIPQRRLGNILQDINTSTPGNIVITASAKSENTNDVVADVNRAISHCQDLVNQNRPNAAEFINLRLTDVTQNHSKIDLTATVSVTYEFVMDLATVNSPDSDIILFPIAP